MKIKAVIIPKHTFKSLKPLVAERRCRHLFIFYLSLAVFTGIIIYSYKEDEISIKFTEYFSDYIRVISADDKAETVYTIIIQSLPGIIAFVFLSTSAIGGVLIYAFSFIKIAGVSTFVAFLYSQYGSAGIKYCFLVFLPGYFIYITSFLILISTCAGISKEFREKVRIPESEIKNKIIRFLFVFILYLLSVGVYLTTVNLFLPKIGISSFL